MTLPGDDPRVWQTYGLRQRPAPKSRRASCEEVDCPNHLHGWRTVVDVSTELGQKQARYLNTIHPDRFTVEQVGDLITYTFHAGQQCFQEHWMEKQQLFVVRGGNRQANTGLIRTHTRGELWVEDFQEHQQGIADRRARG